MDSLNEKQWGAINHISALLGLLLPMALVLGPLLVWMLKRNESAFINEQGKQAVNFQLTILLASFVFMLLGYGMKLLMAISAIILVGGMVFAVIAAFSVYQGKSYRYPYAFRFIK